MTAKLKIAIVTLLTIFVLSACASNKKRRCNSCPKWEDRIEWTSQQGEHEEQHQFRSRP
jgi:outer membrane biogenesis lipoprotein LolB